MATQVPSARMWACLFAMMLTSFSLVSAEFLPGGMLTLIADDLGVTPGEAGQTITVTAVVGLVAALSVGTLAARVDRRVLLSVMALLGAASNLAVAFAPSLPLMLVARFLLGVGLSGFWATSLTVAAKVGGADRVARSMTVVAAGATLASVAGVPLGVVLGAQFGWRVVFVAAAVVTALAALALWFLLPSVPPESGISLRSLANTVRRVGVPAGLTGHILLVFGNMAAFAYVRVALERVPGIDTAGAARLLLIFGLGGLVGNVAIGMVAARWISVLRFAVPGAIATAIAVLALWPSNLALVTTAMALWGAAFSSWLVVLNTWLAKQVPDRLEAGGGLVVAGFQLAIALGAAVGGVLVDSLGIVADLLVAAGLAYAGMVLFGTARARARHDVPDRAGVVSS